MRAAFLGIVLSLLRQLGLAFVAAILVAAVLSAVDRRTGAVGRWLVRVAVVLLPRDSRPRFREEWAELVEDAGRTGVRPLRQALSLAVIGAPRMAILLRLPLSRRIRVWLLTSLGIPSYLIALVAVPSRVAAHAGWESDLVVGLMFSFFGLSNVSRLGRYLEVKLNRSFVWPEPAWWLANPFLAIATGVDGSRARSGVCLFLGILIALTPCASLAWVEWREGRRARRRAAQRPPMASAANTDGGV